MAENDSFTKFSSLLEGILDQVEDLDMRMAANGKMPDGEPNLDAIHNTSR